jgi:hypothetical protein
MAMVRLGCSDEPVLCIVDFIFYVSILLQQLSWGAISSYSVAELRRSLDLRVDSHGPQLGKRVTFYQSTVGCFATQTLEVVWRYPENT